MPSKPPGYGSRPGCRFAPKPAAKPERGCLPRRATTDSDAANRPGAEGTASLTRSTHQPARVAAECRVGAIAEASSSARDDLGNSLPAVGDGQPRATLT